MPVPSRQRERRSTIFGVCMVRIDVLSLKKHLDYPHMSVPCRPRERRWAIFGIYMVMIDVLLFQKHLDYSLYPFSAAQESGVAPYSVSARLGLTPSHSKSIFTTPSCPLLAAQQGGVRPYSMSTRSGSTPLVLKASIPPPHAHSLPPLRVASVHHR